MMQPRRAKPCRARRLQASNAGFRFNLPSIVERASPGSRHMSRALTPTVVKPQ